MMKKPSPTGIAAMHDPYDAWFVRFPDGRVVRAKTTIAVRHNVESGRIPVESWVRRRGEDDWSSLEWTVEFADLVVAKRKELAGPDKAPGPRTEPDSATKEKTTSGRNHNELRTVGVRGLLDELLAALDSTLGPRKLCIAALTCLFGTALLLTARRFNGSQGEPPWLLWISIGLGLAAVLGIGAGLLTRITFVELSRLRQARWGEAFGRLGHFGPRIMGCYILVGGAVLLAILGLRNFPGWVLTQQEGDPVAAATPTAIATVVSLLLQVLLWPILGLGLLLPPAVIVEECPILPAIVQWWTLVRRNLGRVIIYEGLAFALGTVMTLPFLVPVLLAGAPPLQIDMSAVTGTTLVLLGGCALTPLVAYLVVANVFIYLNLRYEFSASLRE